MRADIVIVGAGMTGSLLGCALGVSKLFSKVLLLDSSAPTQNPSPKIPDSRVVTLTPASQFFMNSIGVWDLIPDSRRASFEGMQVWDYYGTGSMKFDNSKGWVIENREIVNAGYARLKDLGVEVLAPSKLKSLTRETGQVQLELEDGKIIEASLIVGADGKDSKVRNDLKIGAWRKAYPHIGLVCTIKVENKSQMAFQKFLKTGPLALLPLWGDYFSVVWSAPPDVINSLIEVNEEEFMNRINIALSQEPMVQFPSNSNVIVPKVSEICSKRLAFPYSLMQANQFVQPRVALVGDAAHTIHPMAGQGYNLGVYDVANLANVLCEGAKVGRDPGDLTFLEKYSKQSRIYNLLYAGLEESILLSYTDTKIVNYLRNLKYSLVDSIPPLKDFVQRKADGYEFIPEKFEWTKE